MDWEFIAPTVILVVFILTVGGVLIRDLLETMSARIRLIEDRQNLTERLLGSGGRAEKEP